MTLSRTPRARADCNNNNLTKCGMEFFKILGYSGESISFSNNTFEEFKRYYERINKEKALGGDWKYVDLLFEINEDSEEISPATRDEMNISKMMFFAIELKNTQYSGSSLAQISREVNKQFENPVVILFKYGDKLSLSVPARRVNRMDWYKDVIGKVVLIKSHSARACGLQRGTYGDIYLLNPNHSSHSARACGLQRLRIS